jgi:hypothetical protein
MIAYPKASYHAARVNASKLMKDSSIRADIEMKKRSLRADFDRLFEEKYSRRRRPIK